MYKAFRGFGEILDIEMSAYIGLTVSFVQLSAASKLRLSQSPLLIADRQYVVHRLSSDSTLHRPSRISRSIPDTLLRPAADQQSPRNILVALNDDCLLEILRRLHLLDLLSAAHVCRRLNALAREAFNARYRNGRRFGYVHLNAHTDGHHQSLWAVEKCVRTFDPAAVELAGRINENVVLRLMADHCSRLDELDLGDAEQLEPQTLWALRPSMPTLKRLDICAQLVRHSKANDTDAWQLERLRVDGHTFHPTLPNINMPKLVELTLAQYMDGFYGSELRAFFARNAHIERLCFSHCRISVGQLHRIAEYLVDLKALCVDACWTRFGDGNDGDAGRFAALEYCRLEAIDELSGGRILDLLSGAPIAHLQVHATRCDGLVDRIATFTGLRTLELEFLEQTIDGAGLMRMTRPLSNLRQLFVVCADVGLGDVRRLLDEVAGIKALRIGLSPYGRIPIVAGECGAIAAIVARRPGLSVQVEAVRRCIQVSFVMRRVETGFFWCEKKSFFFSPYVKKSI